MRITNSLLAFFVCLTVNLSGFSQDIKGAWERIEKQANGDVLKSVLIISNGFQVLSTFDFKSGEFIETNGGSWSLKDNMMTEVVEFHTADTSAIGKKFTFQIKCSKNNLQIVGTNKIFTRIDDGTPGALQGAWLMSGRIRNGKTQLRNTNRPRKTMKILSGKRFQWIAYNVETKEFKGTGGGTYTTINGKYTEHIEFFSRDNSKAGKSLEFDFNLIDGKWHHSGYSSKGKAMHEIWSRRD